LSFDSIELNGRAPSAAAIEHAIAVAAPPLPTEPGFYLRDDAGGRFQVDHDTGVISIADPALLAREANAIHRARLLVVERSGQCYELDMSLRLTSAVPQLVGAEEMDFTDFVPAKPRRRIALAAAPVETTPAPAAPWSNFAAAHAFATPAPLNAHEDAPFGALIAASLFAAGAAALDLAIEPPPPPSGASAIWSL
jgi:hypothetical protein